MLRFTPDRIAFAQSLRGPFDRARTAGTGPDILDVVSPILLG